MAWKIGEKISHKLKLRFNANEAIINFEVNPALIEKLSKDQYPYLFPEPIVREISLDKSKVIIHNRYAIADRNPVRIVVIPYDVFGVPSLTKNMIKVETVPALKVKQNFENKLNFVDISSKVPMEAIASVKIANKQIKKENIYFAPNCSRGFLVCVKKPQYFWWYINTVIRDKMRLLINSEQQ